MVSESKELPTSTTNHEDFDQEIVPSNEFLLPPNYPEYLFSGTSLKNSEKIQEQGFAKGRFTANPIFAIADRFYRGSFLIAKYTPRLFKPYEPDTFKSSGRTFTDFTIEHGQNPNIALVEFNNVGTGMWSQSRVVERLPVTKLDNAASVELTRAQRDFIGSVFVLFGTGTMDFYSKPAPAQEETFKVLGIDFSKISNRHELQALINERWRTENQFAAEIIHYFPGEIKIQWQNGEVDIPNVLHEIVKQIYLIQIIKNAKTLSEPIENAQMLNVINYFPEGAGADYIRSITERSLDDFCNLTIKSPKDNPIDLASDLTVHAEPPSLSATILDPNELDF